MQMPEEQTWRAGTLVGDAVISASLDENESNPTWIHFLLEPGAEQDPRLQDLLGHCPLTYEDVLSGHMRVGLEQRNGTVALMVTTVTPDLTYAPLGVFVQKSRIITVSPKGCPLVDELFDAWVEEPEDIGLDAPGMLHSILDAVVDDYFPALDRIHDQVDALEDSIYDSPNADIASFLQLKRDLLTMRKHIGPVRDNLNGLIRYGTPIIPQSKILDFTDVYNHCLRVSENIDLRRDILSSIMDTHLALVSNRLNEVMRVLTVISTVLMVCSLIAGIYGMNFAHMPELGWSFGYPLSLVLMVISAAMIIWVFRRKGYF